MFLGINDNENKWIWYKNFEYNYELLENYWGEIFVRYGKLR